ncbi:hypothetical protein C0674_14110 [Sporolactobacillus terrae]|uniref:YfhD family protein n=1 Tax=Sporolactobacillus terrae TaxID=269673 RepID=A0ABX5QAK5_9BACL|nr:hypothetical protein C0674_14110 [Sporolactobacillus terrae]QAA26600.1 hypothetical protein C0679_14095 [Sporolactobacillus terrae]
MAVTGTPSVKKTKKAVTIVVQKKDEKKNQSAFEQEFAEPLDEHSVEERERAQRTGDSEKQTNGLNKQDHQNH